MDFDWDAIDRDFGEQTRGVEGLSLDHERIEGFARRIRSGELNAEYNRVRGELRFAREADVDALDRLDPSERERLREIGHEAIRAGRVAVAVLNGGMATRFGGEVKGIVEAFDGRSFLEIKLAQSREIAPDLPFLIMNSFATHLRTLEYLAERGLEKSVHPFLQDVSLRLTPEGEAFREAGGRVSLYAPGHGDLPSAMRRAGLVERLRADGVELITLSNIDNLGADLDPLVIGVHLDRGCELTAEVARAISGDAGGSPAFVDGELQIVEGFRYPLDFDASTLDFLATNSFSISLDALERDWPLTWFYVEKQVDGKAVVQMERLVNELSARVPTAYLAVPRGGADGRFFPVKVREDLVAMRADPQLVSRFGRGRSQEL